MNKLPAIAITCAFLLGACAIQPIKAPPPTTNRGGIALDIRTHAFAHSTLFLIKVEDKENLKTPEIIAVNTCPRTRCYLFNAEPGTYAIVAIARARRPISQSARVGSGSITVTGRTTHTYFFEEDSMRKSFIQVEPGKLTVVGGIFFFLRHRGLAQASPLQKFYAEKIVPGSTSKDQTGFFVFQHTAHFKEINKDPVFMAKFKEAMQKELLGTGWLERLK